LRESIYNIFTFRLGSTELTRRAVREKVSFKELSARKDRVILNENEIISNQIRSNGVSVYNGFGSFVTPNRVRVETSEGGEIIIEGQYVLIATGSRPVRPAKIPFDDKVVCDSDSILNLEEVPKSLTVIGGGVIGCEYASMFSALGVDVHLVDKKSDILPFIDQEITEVLKKALISQGCRLYLGDEFVNIAKTTAGEVETTLKSGRKIKTGALLYAMGRGAYTEKLNLEAIGIKTDERGQIEVNKNYVTAIPGIYAVGDVIGFPSLASSSFEQGRIAACHAFNIPHGEFPEQFPYGIYTIPEISCVGKTEEALVNEGTKYLVGRAEYRETARGQIIADDTGLLKICFCPETLKIHGIHVIGNSASELVHLGQMVMTLGGDMLTLVRNIFNYPTLAEAYKIAAFNGLNKTFQKADIRH
jgi:NAD(P) transhydrogenase